MRFFVIGIERITLFYLYIGFTGGGWWCLNFVVGEGVQARTRECSLFFVTFFFYVGG
jgi:hypothetical protein